MEVDDKNHFKSGRDFEATLLIILTGCNFSEPEVMSGNDSLRLSCTNCNEIYYCNIMWLQCDVRHFHFNYWVLFLNKHR